MVGDYRWYPSDDNIAKAHQALDAVQGQPYLRGFSYGDEVNLKQWAPKDGRDEGLRAALQARGASPEDVLPPNEAAEVAGQPDEQRWQKVRFVEEDDEARRAPRLYVESRRWLVQVSLDRLAAQSVRLREAFGDDIVYGPNYSPHPFFWPEEALFVQAFRRGAINRASHSDYWWQVGELGPQMTGFILDTFRCGLRDRTGVIQTFAMPHSPGTTDADFRRTAMTSIAHGAKALDYFQVTPEQANTENYIAHDDLSRYLTVRDVTYEIGAVDDLIADGRLRGASVAILLSESTDAWDRITRHGRWPPARRSGRLSEHRLQPGAQVHLVGAAARPGAGRHRGRGRSGGRQPRAVQGAVRGSGSHLAGGGDRAGRLGAPSGVAAKETILKVHLVPLLGAKRLDAVSNEDIQRLKSRLRDRAPKTVNNVLTVLNTMLKKGVEWGAIERVPCAIRLLPVPPPSAPFHDFDEFEQLVESARKRGPDAYLVVLLGGEAGLRRGEIAALEWRDIDLKKRTTQRYMHLSPAALDAAIRLLDSLTVRSTGDIVATTAEEQMKSSV